MKTLLITGASGYLGTRLKKQLEGKWDIIEFNLGSAPLAKLLENRKIDGVIHLAACYGRMGQSAAQIAASNVLMPLDVLEAAIKNGAEFFINTDTILAPHLNPYALTKSQFKEWLSLHADKIKCINLRLDHFYGPFDATHKFIAMLISRLAAGVESIDLTEGLQKRDFIYIDDVVNAYLCALDNIDKLPGGVLNNFDVVSGAKITIKEAALIIKQLLKNDITRLNFGAAKYRPGEVMEYQTDSAALKKLGWQAKINFEDGIKKIIEEEGLLA